MDHSYYKERVSAYIDMDLPVMEQELMHRHLAECEECRALEKQLRDLDKFVASHSQLAGDSYWEQNARKIESRLGIEQPTTLTSIRPKSREFRWKLVATAATVALMAFLAINYDNIWQEPNETMPSQDGDTSTVINDTVATEVIEGQEATTAPEIGTDDAKAEFNVTREERESIQRTPAAVSVTPPAEDPQDNTSVSVLEKVQLRPGGETSALAFDTTAEPSLERSRHVRDSLSSLLSDRRAEVYLHSERLQPSELRVKRSVGGQKSDTLHSSPTQTGKLLLLQALVAIVRYSPDSLERAEAVSWLQTLSLDTDSVIAVPAAESLKAAR